MGEAFITRRGDGKPLPPKSYTFFQLVTGSLTWTAPAVGWYRIYCVGRSGSGGSGLAGNTVQNFGSPGGGGGGSGGTAISILLLKAGQAVPITVNNNLSSFGSYLSATAGGNGGVGIAGQYGSGGDPGVPGQAFGGNVTNSTGLYGGRGGKAPATAFIEDGESVGGNAGGKGGAYNARSGGGGGSGNNLQSLGGYYAFINKYGGNGSLVSGSVPATNPWVAPQAITSPPVLYGSGGGGGGGSYSISEKNPTAGGLGTPGCIIIERGVG